MKKLIFISLFFSSFFIYSIKADIIPQDKNLFCERFVNKTKLMDLSLEMQNRLSFKNSGGLINGGVCWWHSRFQRNLLYLSLFDSNLPMVSKNEYRQIIKDIRKGEKIITIPGFKNVNDFSRELNGEIQKELENWQLYDGLVLGGWLEGIKGDTKVSSNELELSMNTLYLYFNNGEKIPYLKLQIKGITSHAWLISHIEKTSNGYTLRLIDSNYPQRTSYYQYTIGDESFHDTDWGNFVPYLRFTNEEKRLSNISKKYCGIKTIDDERELDYSEGYELDLKEF